MVTIGGLSKDADPGLAAIVAAITTACTTTLQNGPTAREPRHAVNANAALYASMIVYTLAMLAFTWHLAARAPKVADSRRRRPSPADERAGVLVGAGGADDDRAPSGDRPVCRWAGFEESLKSRQRGSIALMLTYLASALLVASVAHARAGRARPPWGNMFEFATAAAAAVGAGLLRARQAQQLAVARRLHRHARSCSSSASR